MENTLKEVYLKIKNNELSDEEAQMLINEYKNNKNLHNKIVIHEDEVCTYLITLISKATKIKISKINSSSNMEGLGIDSVLAMDITYALEKEFGNLPKTLFYEFKTIKDLANYFINNHEDILVNKLKMGHIEKNQSKSVEEKKVATANKALKPIISNSTVRDNNNNDDIAIIGISGRFPEADNLDEFWSNLKEGKDCIIDIPKERWDIAKMFKSVDLQNKIKCKFGGFLKDIDKFDPLFFNISPKEAEIIDPQERIFLEETYKAIEDSGYTPKDLSKYGDIGVFVGVMYQEYQLYGPQQTLLGKDLAMFGNPSSIANRVSFFYNFNGPSMAIDTMCSSSLTALHLGCQSVKSGETKAAIVGGVNLSLHPNKYLALSQGNFLSKEGRCKSFSEEANGYVPSEGVGAIIIKSLKDAENDGDNIYGIIRSTSINHGGRTNGYSVPSPVSQSIVIEKAINKSGINPREISYLEAHGTGTSLGDPIEIDGLNKVFKKYSNELGYCKIGSVKSNIGHSESAAGMAALFKVLLQMKNKKLVPTIHCKNVNSNINFKDSPFTIQSKLEDWTNPEINGKKVNRIAGISSFGAGGSNAHVIIEEYNKKIVSDEAYYPVIIPLSAKNKELLTLRVKKLLNYFENNDIDDRDMLDISFTLQVGRVPMEERIAILGYSIEDIKLKLNKILNNEEDIYICMGKVEEGKIVELFKDDDMSYVVEEWINKGKLIKIMELWSYGMDIDWNKLYLDKKVKRISLPTYDFLKRKCWAPDFELLYSNEITKNSNLLSNDNIINNEPTIINNSHEVDEIFQEVLEEVIEEISIEDVEIKVLEILQDILCLKENEVSRNSNFIEIGFDSIASVELMEELSKEYNIEIPVTKTYDFTKVKDLAKYVYSLVKEDPKSNKIKKVKNHKPSFELTEKNTTNDKDKSVNHSNNSSSKEMNNKSFDIAIIGIDGKFPEAENVHEFWSNILNKKDCISVVPKSRWDINKYYTEEDDDNKSYSKWMGVLKNADKFDPLFFNISPSEAMEMDPQQRLFIESAYHAVEDAGINPDKLYKTKCGVFVGCSQNTYGTSKGLKISRLGGATSILSARISYLLNLRGPAFPVDTACSSSLVAIAEACNNLVLNNCDIAIAGGVYIIPSSELHIVCSKGQMLSKDGKCFTFDSRANGFVPGEGVGAIILKRLDDAIRDNDNIHCVIKGWNVNQDGKTNGITAPSVASQVELETDLYNRFNINPEDISLIECHGTGTSLGDPIEVDALIESFNKYTNNKNYCALGSVKSNIGHLINASGVASLFKTIMALKNKIIPATINFKEKNKFIKIENSPFYINTNNTEWKTINNKNRMAAISSFGFSGTNCHIVLEEYNRNKETLPFNGNLVFAISAKDKIQLMEYVKNSLKFIEQNNINLLDYVYTLQTGRASMKERIAFVFNVKSELISKLKDILLNNNSNIYIGTANVNLSSEKIIDKDLNNICSEWVKGKNILWEKLYENIPVNKISIPTYPFKKESYWINETDYSEDNNLIISKDELFIKDHMVQGQNIMPGVVYLEIAKKHIEKKLSNGEKCILKNVKWLRPMIFNYESLEVECIMKDKSFKIISKLGSRNIIHCTGQFDIDKNTVVSTDTSYININDIISKCKKEINSQDIYDIFSKLGLSYGNSHRGIKKLYIGDNYVLSKLYLEKEIFNNYLEYSINPGLIDSAFQSALGLFLNDNLQNESVEKKKLKIPSCLEKIHVFNNCTNEMWAYVVNKDDTLYNEKNHVDIVIVNTEGNIIMKIDNLELTKAYLEKNEFSEENNDSNIGINNLLCPIWNETYFEEKNNNLDPKYTIIFTNNKLKTLNKYDKFKNYSIFEYNNSYNFINIINENSNINNIVWIYCNDSNIKEPKEFINEQNNSIMPLFDFVKNLMDLGYESKKINWTIITENTQCVNPYDYVNPCGSGIIGFIGSVVNEISLWNLRLIDYDENDLWQDFYNVPYTLERNIAYRDGEWFTQELGKVKYINFKESAYKTNGVYIAIGGAGGIGKKWTEYLVKKYNANVIWVGRRDIDDDIRKSMDYIETLGKRPLYIQGDGTKYEDLLRIKNDVISKYGKINGIVDTAIVLNDKSIKKMTKEDFKATYFNKLSISVQMAEVFAEDNLDFFLFFSSMVAFTKGPLQSNYAAGCTFKDSFSYYLKSVLNLNTKIVNWGYWGYIGVVANEFYRNNMKELGILSIDSGEAMDLLEKLLISSMDQNLLVKTEKDIYADNQEVIVDL